MLLPVLLPPLFPYTALFRSFHELVRQPPAPVLFPYTTLFRSLHELVEQLPAHVGEHAAAHLGDLAGDLQIGVDRDLGAGSGTKVTVDTDLQIDRKSTRLNSSHMSISYAVFCLKKKKKNINARE